MNLDKSLNKKFSSFFILFILLAFSFYRSPDIFLQGRFWGEDGSIFFQNSLNNSFFDNFFKVYYPTYGYYNLYPRIIAMTAKAFPIEFAALVNVYMSYLILLYIFILSLFSNSFLIETKKQKFLFCFLVLFCSSLVPEVWANSVNTQIYFSILTIVILYSNSNNNVIFKSLNLIGLFIGGCSSSYVAILFPFFFIKYYFDKSRIFLIEAIVLLFCFLFQLFFYFYSKFFSNMITVNRDNAFLNSLSLDWINLYYLKVFFYNVFLKTIFSKKIILLLEGKLNFFASNKYLLLIFIILIVISIVVFLYKIFLNLLKNKEKIVVLLSLVGIFCTILTMNILVSGSFIAGRYAAIPGFVFSLSILFLSFQNYKKIYLKIIPNIIIIFILLSGVYQFRPNDYQVYFLDCLDNCKTWKEQISSNRDYIILWPYNTGNEWKLKLNK